jgi:hypothetical protein
MGRPVTGSLKKHRMTASVSSQTLMTGIAMPDGDWFKKK